MALLFAGMLAGAPGATAGTPARATCRNANLRPTGTNVTAVARATGCLIAQVRRAQHLPALRTNRTLQSVAVGQSREMVLGDFFGDNSRSGQTPLQRLVAGHYLGCTGNSSTAQNIGWGTGADATPAAMVRAWMESPPHREVILTGEFREIGVGVVSQAPAALAGGLPGATYTVEFGVRR
ncbi:MAG TPA: CAP domain-containing protein [Solirubrobacteraceae bacterium]|nr:CAP domain-containing protein [Solirubrobacteraceae bacterium]